MKLTKYHDIFKIENQLILYNTFNNAIINIEEEIKNKIAFVNEVGGDITIFSDEEHKILVEEGFLVNEEYDIKSIVYDNAGELTKKSLIITVAVSNSCNFICSYCFERDKLDDDNKRIATVEDKSSFLASLKQYIEFVVSDNPNIENLKIVWFGGEPLLEYNFILECNDQLINLCSELNILYSCGIITNGYLLTENRIDKLKAQRLTEVQITIDGDKSIHNKRRTTRNYVDTYTPLLKNISFLSNVDIVVGIRVNVDKENFHSMNKLLEDIEKIATSKITLSFSPVIGSPHSFTNLEFSSISYNLMAKSVEKGLMILKEPTSKFWFSCHVESISTHIAVDIFGNVYLCWQDFFSLDGKVSDNIKDYLLFLKTKDDSSINYSVVEKYTDTLSIENKNSGKCLTCKYFGLCRGMCPKSRENGSIYLDCINYARESLVNNLTLYYANLKKVV